MPTHLLKTFQKLLPSTKIHIPYGFTEARVNFLRIDEKSSTSRLLVFAPNLEVNVIGEEGRIAKTGESGEIFLKGEGLMVGYCKSTEKDTSILRERGLPSEVGVSSLRRLINLMA